MVKVGDGALVGMENPDNEFGERWMSHRGAAEF